MLITITGPTCAGKTTFYKELERIAQRGSISTKSAKSKYKISPAFIPTYTNRPKRIGDFGYEFVNYYHENEYFQTNELAGYKYGTKTADITRLVNASRVPVTIITPEALNAYSEVCKKLHLKHIKCFITGPKSILVERLIHRSAEEIVNTDVEFCRKPINDFIKRLEHLLTVEIEQWRLVELWDYVIPSYTRDNRLIAVEDFLEYLEEKYND